MEQKTFFLDDIHGIIAGVESGMGRAVVPYHLARRNPKLKMINVHQSFDVPVHLHFYAQPFYSKLHQAAVEALGKNCAALLKNHD